MVKGQTPLSDPRNWPVSTKFWPFLLTLAEILQEFWKIFWKINFKKNFKNKKIREKIQKNQYFPGIFTFFEEILGQNQKILPVSTKFWLYYLVFGGYVGP